MARNIDTIFLDASANTDKWMASAKKYNECAGTNITADYAKANFKIGQDYYIAACKCYEYMQFKRSVFKCEKIEYDSDTGRVIGINIKFVKVR